MSVQSTYFLVNIQRTVIYIFFTVLVNIKRSPLPLPTTHCYNKYKVVSLIILGFIYFKYVCKYPKATIIFTLNTLSGVLGGRHHECRGPIIIICALVTILRRHKIVASICIAIAISRGGIHRHYEIESKISTFGVVNI